MFIFQLVSPTNRRFLIKKIIFSLTFLHSSVTILNIPTTFERGIIMAQKKHKFCYAIHYLDTNEDKIVFSWSECQKYTKGRSNNYRGFMSECDALEWLSNFSIKKSVAPQLTEKAKSFPHKPEKKKRRYQVQLDAKTAYDLENRAHNLKLSPELLLKNLVEEYLYDDQSN